jgi:hypothetical protein
MSQCGRVLDSFDDEGEVTARRRSLSSPDHNNWGIVLIRETTCCLLQQTTITTAGNRACEGMRRAISDVESRSPGGVQIVKTAFCGVHRRPNRVPLSVVFLVFLPVSD